ncbi:MAG TPA: D-alanyl-D-alanine carboxypeptidase/D-alanyl-D-alanine-endopeptidase, partial [Phycisphaerae bacterium]|nr:D-alanyl-D-alanine carboxypeptidase/D-alanyl-D-alanine-endopeptidase [Phycisphaerae bacterium]
APLAPKEAGMTELASTAAPLAAVLERANKRSLNMAAECMLLRAGDGTWRRSAKMMAETLVKTYGLEEKDLAVSDGCGLSRKNRVAPAALTRILAAIAGGKDAAVLIKSLPVAGVDGTMNRRLTEAKYRGRVAAKTGYILGVSTLSGYVLDKEGKCVAAFSILANDVPAGKAWQAKDLQDAICRALVDWADGG